MAVDLKLTGKCIGCPYIDINVGKIYGSDGRIEEIFASCKNGLICDRVERYSKGETNESRT